MKQPSGRLSNACGRGLFALAAWLIAVGAQAQVYQSLAVSKHVDLQTGQWETLQDYEGSNDFTSARTSYSDQFANSNSQAAAIAGNRRLGVGGYTRVDGQSTDLGVTSNATAVWSDQVTIDSPSHMGASALWIVRLNFHWKVFSASGVGGAGFAYAGLGFSPNIANSNALLVQSDVRTSEIDSQYAEWDSYVDAFIPIVIGQPFQFTVKLEGGTEAFSWGGGFGNSYFDSMQTVEFAGTQGVSLETGGSVDTFDVISASGTDWVTPVPEPGTFLALSLGALAFRRRRARS